MLNNSKICVIGTHGVGKTTLVNEVVRQLAGEKTTDGREVLYVPELARHIMDALDFDWRVGSLAQIRHFQGMLQDYYLLSATLPGPFISDRSVLDTFAYLSLSWRRHHNHPLFPVRSTFPHGMELHVELAMRCHTGVYFYYMTGDMTKEQQFIQDWLDQACRILGIETRPFYRDDSSSVVTEIVEVFRG